MSKRATPPSVPATPAESALDPLIILAVSKAFREKQIGEARQKVSAGGNEIDCLVQLRGFLTVGEDVAAGNPSTAPATFDPWMLLAIALKAKGAPTLDQLTTQAATLLKKNPESASSAGIKAFADARATELLPAVTVPGSSPRRGAVQFNGKIEVLKE